MSSEVERTERSNALRDRFGRVRRATVARAAPLSAEDAGAQSMPDASPVKWHLAHTTWFFERFVLAELVPEYERFDPAYDYLFNSYYESVGTLFPRPSRGLLTRPTLPEVQAYRTHVDAAIGSGFQALRGDGRVGEWLDRIELGLAHEEQHQELILTDVKHLFAQNPLGPAYFAEVPAVRAAAEPLRFVELDGGLTTVGQAGPGFAFDNERPAHKVYLEPFALASRLVTNSEFLEFVLDGGYHRPELWLAEGFDRVRSEAWAMPYYWRHRDGIRCEFTLHGLLPLDPHAPVAHLSYFEADAFARWAGARLPTEAEWEVAALFGVFSFGELWEWTSSAYGPYPGYSPPAGALGEYNGKFMSSQMVLRGGSSATPPGHVRPSYRNYFPPAARWQFSGLRLARGR